MRALIWIAVIAMGLWSGYWYTGRTAVLRAAEGFFAAAPAQGIEATNDGISLAGFPNRFDLTIAAPSVRDPQSGLGWQAPFLQVFSLSYKPWHVIAAFAPTQTIRTPLEEITVNLGKMQASVVVRPNTQLALDRTTLIGTEVRMASTRGWTAGVDELRFATRAVDPTGARHEIGLEALRLRPDPQLQTLAPGLPDQIDRLRVDAVLGLSAPLDRTAGATRPRIEALQLNGMNIDWGTLSLRAKGDLTVTSGMPEGRLDLNLRGWRALVPLIAASGTVKPELVPTIERMLETLAAQSGDPEELSLPLIITGGQMRLGPLPLGPAPRF